MILVDTNVLSQPLRPDGERRVIEWLDANDADVVIPALSVAELVYGYERLAPGRRRAGLQDAVLALLTRYGDRILPFDRAAAEVHGWLVARMDREGHPLPLADSQIAAIAIARKIPIATRNTRDFDRIGIELRNPWLE